MSGPNFSRAATRAVPSTSRDTKKCGAVVQLCVVRSAMILPIDVMAPSSVESEDGADRPGDDGEDGDAAARAGAVAPAEEEPLAASTSSVTISPPGPVPLIVPTSTP